MSNSALNCDIDSTRLCNDCGVCDRCDLDAQKTCDSCGRCLGLEETEYGEIMIEGFLEDESEVEEYLLTSEEEKTIHRMESDLIAERAGDYEFIEDIPELRDPQS